MRHLITWSSRGRQPWIGIELAEGREARDRTG